MDAPVGATQESGNDAKNHVASVIKACRVVETLAGGAAEYSLAEIAEANDLNKTTAHRLLQTLHVAGWIERGRGGGYRLSLRMLPLGRAAQTQFSIRQEAKPYLDRLAAEFGDDAFLLVPGGQGAVCVEIVQGDSALKVNDVSVGSLLPYHVAGGPTVMAAFDPAIEERVLAGPLEKFTELTDTAVERLREKFARIRREGYVYAEGDLLNGVAAVSAPVFDLGGELIATLSLGGAAQRFYPERRQQIVNAVVESARKLSSQLGYQS